MGDVSRASRGSWNVAAMPERRVALEYRGEFAESDADTMRLGLIPEAMEDKWFIFFEEDWLYFCRSWTGAFIYGLRLEPGNGVARVVESWVSRDAAQYTETDVAYDRAIVHFLIEALLLKKQAVFPTKAGHKGTPPGLVQHVVAGRGYPEKRFSSPGPPGVLARWWAKLRGVWGA